MRQIWRLLDLLPGQRMGKCLKKVSQNVNRALIQPQREPNGLAHLLNPAQEEVQRHEVNDNNTYFSAYEENGRLYHTWKRGLYQLPCDDQERMRYDMIHHMIYCLILKHRSEPGVALAKPIKEQVPECVLDIGTGSGIWPTDISIRYPHAAVKTPANSSRSLS